LVTSIDAKEIYQVLPHAYPMCMLDRVTEVEAGKSAVGIKNLTYNEQFFQGHFPQEPVMPGVLQIEAMAQLGGWLVLRETEGQQAYLTSTQFKFRNPVRPGDQLRLEVEILQQRRGRVRIGGKAYVGEVLVADGELMIAVVETS
jgi:beta-hydroxyacyl-ACP dehydratase FabZ